MLKCIDIDIQPTGLIYQWRLSDKFWCCLRWRQMEHIKIHDDLIRICDDVFRTIIIDDTLIVRWSGMFKCYFTIWAIDFDRRIKWFEIYIVSLNNLHKRICNDFYTKNNCTRCGKSNFSAISHVVHSEIICSQISYFLGCSTAFDGRCWLCEYCMTSLEIL